MDEENPIPYQHTPSFNMSTHSAPSSMASPSVAGSISPSLVSAPEDVYLTYTMSPNTTTTMTTATKGKTFLEMSAEVAEAAARFPMPTWGIIEDDSDTQPLVPWTSPMEIWVDTQVEVARDYYPTPPHSTPVHTPSHPLTPTLGWGDDTLGRTSEDPEVPFQQEKKTKQCYKCKAEDHLVAQCTQTRRGQKKIREEWLTQTQHWEDKVTQEKMAELQAVHDWYSQY